MRFSTLAIAATVAVLASVQPALADECYDLWYERNSIYNDYGYCFKTRDARQTFDNSDCYTRGTPDFSRRDQRRIERIQAREYEYGCN